MIERPVACPKPGEIEAFDAGWDAHAIGIGRETVRVLTVGSGMALLGWDIRQKLSEEAREAAPA